MKMPVEVRHKFASTCTHTHNAFFPLSLRGLGMYMYVHNKEHALHAHEEEFDTQLSTHCSELRDPY